MHRTVLRVFGANVVSKIFVAMAAVLAIRCMNESEYASYTLALGLSTVAMQTFAAVYNVIYLVGFDSLRLVARSEGFLGLQMLMFAGAATIAWIAIPSPSIVFWACIAFVFFGILSEYTKTCYQQRLEFRKYSLLEFMRSGMFFAAALVFGLMFRDRLRGWQMLAAQAAGMMVVFLLAGRSEVGFRRLFDFESISRIARGIWSGPYRFVFLYFIGLAIFAQTDIWSLKLLSTHSQLAAYGAAFRYYSVLQLALGTFSIVLLPSLQKINSGKEFTAIMQQHRKLLWGFGIAAVSVASLAGWIIPILDGGRYPASIAAFRVLAIAAVVTFALSPHSQLLVRFADFKFQSRLVLAVLALSVTLLVILVPAFGALGAAISNGCAMAIFQIAICIRARWKLAQPQSPFVLMPLGSDLA